MEASEVCYDRKILLPRRRSQKLTGPPSFEEADRAFSADESRNGTFASFDCGQTCMWILANENKNSTRTLPTTIAFPSNRTRLWLQT